MERNKHLGTLRTALLIVVATLAWVRGARASTYEVIHLFTWAKVPRGNLTFDAAGNLYGTAALGGPDDCPGSPGCGVVFKLSSSPSGWSETVLHAFIGFGRYPSAPVIFDPAGNLYGTTYGGNGNYGLVFEIKP